MKLTVAYVRDVMDQHHRDEISFTRMVELLNEEVNRKEEVNIKYFCISNEHCPMRGEKIPYCIFSGECYFKVREIVTK